MANLEIIGASTSLDVDPYQFRAENEVSSEDTTAQSAVESSESEISSSTLADVLSGVQPLPYPRPAPVTSGEQDCYRLLHLYAYRGDWRSASSLLKRNRNLFAESSARQAYLLLMVVLKAMQWQFAQKLLGLLPPEALEMHDGKGFTPLHYVAKGGSLETAKALVRKNRELTQKKCYGSTTPLLCSTLCDPRKEMVWYLILVTRPEHDSPSCAFTGRLSGMFVWALACAGFTDIILFLLGRYPQLAFAGFSDGHDLLLTLSSNPSAFASGSKLTFWQKWIYNFVDPEIRFPPRSAILDVENSIGNMERQAGFIAKVLYWFKISLREATGKLVLNCAEQVRDAKLQHKCSNELVKHILKCIKSGQCKNSDELFADYLGGILVDATKSGVHEIVISVLDNYDDLIPLLSNDERSALPTAVEYRQHKIFNLLNKMPVNTFSLSLTAGFKDDFYYNIWHLAANLSPRPQHSSVSGAALQMQRELQWFKEVEKLALSFDKQKQKKEVKTVEDTFREEHKDLAKKAEKWMKDIANSCMIVSTLIATVVFAAAFLVPGGNTSNKGIPLFSRNNLFMVFAIANVLALFSSSASLLIFLSILTARYALEDFLEAVPRRLIKGLGSLFFAIINMMVAFGAALYISVGERWHWISMPIILLASIPVAIFAKVQLPLFIEIIQSTYGSGIFVKRKYQ